jgi:hypothetical protein
MRVRNCFALLSLALLGAGASRASAELLVGLAAGESVQSLVFFDSATPSTTTDVAITGLAGGEALLGIDRRPLTGELFAVSDQSRLFVIHPSTGAATVVGTGFTNALDGTSFGFDFNPQIDRIRIVSDSNQNFVANPLNGDANIAATTPVFYVAGDANEGANPNVVHHAYDRNVAGTPATQLRAIDTELDILVTQANNAGTLATIGPLGVDASDIGGFDVSESGAAFAIFSDGDDASGLYSIDLTTGAATSIGTVPWNIVAMTAVPEPSSLALGALCVVALAGRYAGRLRRKQ